MKSTIHPLEYFGYLSTKGLKPLSKSENSPFSCAVAPKFIHIERRNSDSEGNTRFLNAYLCPSDFDGGYYAVANIDQLIYRAFAISPSGRGLLFRVANNYPLLAALMNGDLWETNKAGLIVSRFSGSAQLHWLLFVKSEIPFSSLRGEAGIRSAVPGTNKTVGYGFLYELCHNLLGEIYDDGFAAKMKAAARGAAAGAIWGLDVFGDPEKARLKQSISLHWGDFLAAVKASNVEGARVAVQKLGRYLNLFNPRFFD